MATRAINVWAPLGLMKRLMIAAFQRGYASTRYIRAAIIIDGWFKDYLFLNQSLLFPSDGCAQTGAPNRYLHSKTINYQPLNQAVSEIRLLKVHSIVDTWGLRSFKLVKAELISVPIASAPPFAAVSYRWTYSSSLPILLGERRSAASRSICELLSALQFDANHPQEELFLWIDSICINQADNEEKSWHIGLMQDIYRSAEYVIGWLGFDAPPVGTWRGIDGVREVADIVCNDFFFRTWIIQEVSLAKRMVMYTQHDECLWDGGVLQIARSQGPAFSLYGENEFGLSSSIIPRLGHGVKNMNSIEAFRILLKENPDGIPLGELLIRSAEFQCTDPRDRIYGLLGLTTANARSNILVDYSDTYSELETSIQAVRFSILGESSFQLLELSGEGLNHTEPQGQWSNKRPSWIPDWQASHIPRMKEKLAYASSHETATHLPCKVGTPAESANFDKLLHIEGAIVDKIKQLITTAWHLPETCDFRDKKSLTHINEFLDHLDMVCAVARGDQSHPSGLRDVHDAILRIVTQGGSKTRAEKPDFEEIRLNLEKTSQTLRARLSGEQNRVRRDRIVEMDFRHFVMGLEELMPLILERMLCITEQGRFAIVPAFAKVGDEICVFSGAPSPFVLRLRDEAASTRGDTHVKRYKLIGVSCVNGIMNRELREADLKLEIFQIR